VTEATTGWDGRRTPLRGDAGALARPAPASLVDVLERVLDKGIVIVGDIRVNLVDIELLTIKVRLLIASVDRAREMGINWWEHDPTLSARDGDLAEENRRLRSRIAELESPGPDAAPEGAGGESGDDG
jgi:hypothetical protein